MRTPFIAGNWKMHKTIEEAVALVAELRALLEGVEGIEIGVCPPFPALAAVRNALDGSPIRVGAQNMHWEDAGAFTGEVSPTMLQGLVHDVIIGHSERRTLFGETDEMINRKIHTALARGLTPIVCVGENLEQNQAGETESFVGAQVRDAFAGVEADQARTMVVAYEPIWAIGTGIAAHGPDAARIIGSVVRGTLADLYGDDVAQAIRIQYGGSAKPGNIAEFMSEPEIDGALVGGASLDAATFAALARNGLAACSG
jgi:triosephosphate isomerase